MLLYPQFLDSYETRLLKLHRDAAELVGELSIDTILERIPAIALERTGASYAAIGTLNESGNLEKFVTAGMPRAQIAQIPHPPRGLGLIRMMMDTNQSIRINNIARDPRHSGFPEHHPAMTSFLGVPIFQGKRQIGQIYVTNKLNAPGFNEQDEINLDIRNLSIGNYFIVITINNNRYINYFTIIR